MIVPEGTTHVQTSYANCTFFKSVPYTYVNRVIDHPTDQFQQRASWYYHSFDKWVGVGSGFSTRLLIPIDKFIVGWSYIRTDEVPAAHKGMIPVEYEKLQPIVVKRNVYGAFECQRDLVEQLKFYIENQTRLCRLYLHYGDGVKKCVYFYQNPKLDESFMELQ